MRKFPYLILILAMALGAAVSCNSDDDTDAITAAYQEWYDKNQAWLEEQVQLTNEDGTPYYTQLVAQWDPSAYVLIHYINDRALTEGNLSPLYTSSVDTRYYVTYYDGTPLDSSSTLTTYGQGIFRTQLTDVITGWAIALQDMRVGDTAEVVIPYQQAYGVSVSSSVAPYTNLKFNVRLVDIVAYEKNPLAVED